MEGGRANGRTVVSMSMDPNKPPPLSSIPATSGRPGGGGGGGTIVVTSSQQQTQQSSVLRRTLASNDQVTVVAVRNAPSPMITISSSAPPLASFGSSIRPSLPSPSPSTLVSIDQREGTVFINRMPPGQTARGRDHSVPTLPRPPAAVGTTMDIPRKDANEIVIGRKELTFPTPLSYDEVQQQNLGLYKTIQSKIGTGYTVQIGSTDIMSSHQPAKIAHSTTVKQSTSIIPASHINSVGPSGHPIGGGSTTTVLLPGNAPSPHTGAGTGTADFQRLANPNSSATPSLKVYQRSKPLLGRIAAVASTVSSQSTYHSLGKQRQSLIVPPSDDIISPANYVGATGTTLIVHPSSTVITSATAPPQQQQPLHTPALFPANSAQIKQHVLPFGTTIKVKSSTLDQQLAQATNNNTIVSPVNTGSASIVASPVPQQHPGPARSYSQRPTAVASIPVTQQASVKSAASMVFQNFKAPVPSAVTPAGPVCSTAIPPLYVPSTTAIAKVTASTGGAVKTLHTSTAAPARLVDGAGEFIHKRVVQTASRGQPQRFIMEMASCNTVGQQQIRVNTSAEHSLPPVPKLAPFITQTLQMAPPHQAEVTPTMAVDVELQKNTNRVSNNSANVGNVVAPIKTAHPAEPTASIGRPSAFNTIELIEKPEIEHTEEQNKQHADEEMSKESPNMEEEHIIEIDDKSDQIEEEEQQQESIEILDSSIDSNGNEPQSAAVTPEKTGSKLIYMEISRLDVTPRKSTESDCTNTSRVSPRMQKRALSEQQQEPTKSYQLGVDQNISHGPTVSSSQIKQKRRKRSESVHVRISSFSEVRLIEQNKLDQAASLENLVALPTDPSPTVGGDASEAGVAIEGRQVKRQPLKDATNEAAEDGSGVATKGLLKPERKGPSGNIVLLCSEKFDMVSSTVDRDGEERKQSERRSSRRLCSNRRGGEADSATEIKRDMEALSALGISHEVPETGKKDAASVVERHSKKKRLKKDQNNIDFSNVRSTSTSSESNMVIGEFGRESRPEPATTTRKKSSGKNSSSTASRRQAGIRASIAAPPSESSFSVPDDKDSKDGGAGAAVIVDTSTVAEQLRWHDGIGYMCESLRHFELNEFGLVVPLPSEQFNRHCSTDVYEKLVEPIAQRVTPITMVAQARKRRKPLDVKRMYRCNICKAIENAAEFLTPDYCSLQCVEQSGKVALLTYIKNSTKAQQRKGLLLGPQGTDTNWTRVKQEEQESQPSAKKQKHASEKTQQQTAAVTTNATAKGQRGMTTPSTTTTTTSDEDSRSSLSLNSKVFVDRQHLGSLPPTSPLSADDVTPPTDTAGEPKKAANGAELIKDEKMAFGDENEFTWEKYLRHVKGVPAPMELFGRQPYPATINNFRPGMKVEAIDPENCSLFCVCTVVEVRGYRIKLHFDGFSADYDFWVNADSPNIFPPGWCRSTRRVLQPPNGYTSDGKLFRWKEYLLQTSATVPDHRWFAHINRTQYSKNTFEIGMSIEADDLKKSGKVCVATVADKMGERIMVHFDGWDQRYDYWVNINSPYIHPVNWHTQTKDKITPPPDWHKPFLWEKYIRLKKRIGTIQAREAIENSKIHFQPRPPVSFKPGQRLEVVDRRQKKLIRPATVIATDGYEVQLCFDGWPTSYAFWIEDDSPSIHPINWCARTKHPLEPPPNYLNEIATYDGICEFRICLGRGNTKFPNKKFHDRPLECPYSRSNWMAETRKTLRVSHNQVQKHLTDVIQGLGLYEPVLRRASVFAPAKTTACPSPQGRTRSASPRPAKPHPFAADKAGTRDVARRPSVIVAPATSSAGLEVRLSDIKQDQELVEPKESLQITALRAEPDNKQSTNTDRVVQETLRIAMPVIGDYGPRLLHSYEVWRENSRILDECTERGAAGDELRQKNPLHWTTDEMARYIEQLPGCNDCATKIRLEEINGKSFLSFTQDDLVKYMGIKVGPAIKIYNRIIHLRHLVTTKFIQL